MSGLQWCCAACTAGTVFVHCFSMYCYACVFRNVENVHNLMDDIAEQHDIADELSDALSNAVGFSQDISDVSFCYTSAVFQNFRIVFSLNTLCLKTIQLFHICVSIYRDWFWWFSVDRISVISETVFIVNFQCVFIFSNFVWIMCHRLKFNLIG